MEASVSTTIKYDKLHEALLKVDANADAAESHGMLCGLICGTGETIKDKWLEQILGQVEQGNLLMREAQTTLDGVHQATLEQITDGNFELELVLPDDEQTLDTRIGELGEWCQGFLIGLSLAGVSDVSKLPGEAGEIVSDLLEITRAGYDPAEDEEVNENAYAEVVEYVRIGVLVIYNELHHQHQKMATKTLH